VVTLLHGNESSGVKAIHRWLLHSHTPETDMVFFIGYVAAALHPPGFTHRSLPGESDLNRCFSPPYDTEQGQLAKSLLTMLSESKPEAIIDLHNTSSNSEPFAVTFNDTESIRQLSTLATHNLLLMKTPLGTLLEHSHAAMPIVTIEFGKSTDPRSDHLANELIEKYTSMKSLFNRDHQKVHLLENPVRLELQEGATVAYSDSPVANTDVTLLHSIDTYNFLNLSSGTIIGWVHGDANELLRCRNADSTDILNDLLSFNEGKIHTRTALTLSMATTNPTIAVSDCLAYLIPT
jgi:succinylglutamate desuccinylase